MPLNNSVCVECHMNDNYPACADMDECPQHVCIACKEEGHSMDDCPQVDATLNNEDNTETMAILESDLELTGA